MSDFEKVVEVMARTMFPEEWTVYKTSAYKTRAEKVATFGRVHRGLRALRAAGFAVVPRKGSREMKEGRFDDQLLWSALLAVVEVRDD